jgi:hypothetical protein
MLYFGRVGSPLGHRAFFGSSWREKVITQKKKKKFGFWGWLVARSPPKALGVVRPPPDQPYGVVETTPMPLGVVRPPPKPLTFFFVLFFGLLGVVKADWGGSSTSDRPRGWLEPPPWPIMGWPATHLGNAGHLFSFFRFL